MTDGHPPDFMPWMRKKSDYDALLHQLHKSLYELTVEVDFVFPKSPDFSGYKLLIVPALYVADEDLLTRIAEFVRGGGHVLMTFKSGFADENSRVRWTRQPGPLREAAGFSYQEFSTLEHPLALRDDPFAAGDANQVFYWAEFLVSETAHPLAFYDHPFFGRWPAITRNRYGAGALTYLGTWPSPGLLTKILADVLGEAAIAALEAELPAAIRVKHGINTIGKPLHYYLNYSHKRQAVRNRHTSAIELLSGAVVDQKGSFDIEPWGVVILEER